MTAPSGGLAAVGGRRALVCSYTAPQYDRDSGSQRIAQFVDLLLEAGWSVSFLAVRGGEKKYEHALQRRGIQFADIATTDAESFIAEGGFNVALLAYWPVAEYFLPVIRSRSPRTRVVVESIDLHFLRDARYRFGVASDRARRRGLTPEDGARMAAELNTYANADLVLTVSDDETALLRRFLERVTAVGTVPLGGDVAAAPVPSERRAGILFVGSFRHAPNLGAVGHLFQEILPRLDPALLARHPVYVVGDALNDTVRQYAAGTPGARLVGWVPTLTPYFERCRVAVVPLLYGAGVKGKTVQALLAGLPTVTTTVGAEGLDLESGRHAVVADDPTDFAAGIERLLRDDGLWADVAREGRAYVLPGWGRAAVKERFRHHLDGLTHRDPKPGGGTPDAALLQARLRTMWIRRMVESVRPMISEHVPDGGRVLVVSGDDGEFPDIPGVATEAFPSTNGAGVDQVLHELDSRAGDAEFLLVPESSRNWLDRYPSLRGHIDTHYRVLVDRPDAGILVELRSDVRIMAVRDPERPRAVDRAPVRVIAFLLPQFHPIPENDRWWGEGFTEWTNVTKATTLFPGHHQPHLPADLGFYDLRLPSVREEQAELARRHGVAAFCYYHYWFSGRRLLERPFSEVLARGRPDFPFVLCWANEPWSRRWNGRAEDVLQPQTYSAGDDLDHIESLLPALADPRAVTVDGKPVFIVYQARDLPDPAATVDRWRHAADRAGLRGLYLLAVETGWDQGWDATRVGFDGKVLFQPQFSALLQAPRLPLGPETLRVYDYREAVRLLGRGPNLPYPAYETVCTGWDNTPRTGSDGWVLHGSTPAAYEAWLSAAVDRAAARPPDQRIVFVNAWNEWAEGAHLEPDQRHGLGYLQATKRAVEGCSADAAAPRERRIERVGG